MQPSFYNTLSRKIEKFEPLNEGKVSLYTCGPTVYNYAHIGNLRTYIFEDVLARTIRVAGYKLTHVMNITDVGHLESDADEGDDKMALAAKREHRSPWDIAKFYENAFFDDCAALHIKRPDVVCRATDHINEMIEMIKTLIDKGYAYAVDGNVYFRIAQFPTYTELSRRKLEDLMEGARVDIDARKEDPRDFVLWFSQSKYPNQIMKWESPWGVGFPGWHIECSVMASKYLGERIDIHCGGIDHISVHHTNEIAQSEAAFGHKWVNTWMHGEFLVVDKSKMSKSTGNFLTVKTLRDEGFDPVHYRFFCLGAHYRSQLFFSFAALVGARNAFESIRNRVISWKLAPAKKKNAELSQSYKSRFWDAMMNDLDTPVALSVLWEMAKDAQLASSDKLELIRDFDQVLGFNVDSFQKPELAPELMDLVRKREQARKDKNWQEADVLRKEVEEKGLQLMDTAGGTEWYFAYKD